MDSHPFSLQQLPVNSKTVHRRHLEFKPVAIGELDQVQESFLRPPRAQVIYNMKNAIWSIQWKSKIIFLTGSQVVLRNEYGRQAQLGT